MRRVAMCAVVLGLIAGCGGGPGTENQGESVLEADRSFSRAMSAKDSERFVEFLAEDAVFYGFEGVSVGRQQVVEQWEPMLDPDRLPEMSWVPEEAEVSESGDLAVTRGHYRIARHVTEEGTMDVTGHYMTVWRREPSGAWKVVWEMETPPEP